MNRSSWNFPKAKADPRAGFTLIEVLAGLFITGLFVMIVVPFITQLVSYAWGGESNLATADAWMRADARLADDIGSAMPLSIAGGKEGLAFKATSTRITFVRRSLAETRTRLEIVSVSIESDGQMQSLLRSARPYRSGAFDDSEPDGESSRIVLLKTPDELRFHVPGYSAGNKLKELPREVELEVENEQGAEGVPFVFPIVARANPLTAVNPHSAP